MKPPHAATLALVGWYLMVPPLRTYTNNPRSFRHWSTEASFDSAADCETAAADWQARMRKARGCDRNPNIVVGGEDCGPFELFLESYQCVATDDPRLKDK